MKWQDWLTKCIFVWIGLLMMWGLLTDASDVFRTAVSPHAEITSVKMPDKIPDTVIVNQQIFIEVTVTNNGGDARDGGISVSFPDNPQVSIIEADTTKTTVYPVGSRIWSNIAKKTFPSRHLLVEAWQEPWKANDTHHLKLKVVPSKAGTLQFFVRATMTVPKGKGQIIATPEVGPLDQQGFHVQEYTVSNVALDNPELFCIAYHLYDGSNRFGDKLYIYLLRKDQNKWIHRALNFETLSEFYRAGTITRINYSQNYIYLFTHINPSAGTTLILSNELKFQGELFGWLLAIFDDETLVYHNSQVHFAPTHSAVISIYNPHTKLHQDIYPMKPYQKIRLEHIKKVKAAYDKRGEDWFRIHNHHGDPELFNNSLGSEVMVNDSTHSLVFVIDYDNTDYWSYEDELKYSNFRQLRSSLEKPEIKASLSYSLFVNLHRDLMQIKRLKKPDQDVVLKLFEDDKELHKMFQDALKTERQEGRSWRQHFNSLDVNWENPEIWEKIAKIIEAPPATTEVVYIYRNVNNSEEITYKEIVPKSMDKYSYDMELTED
ncbi:MAG: hypothetical protein ACE5PV_02795, partial [Candidatus Poribacteria bacterium]